ncbi:MAG: ABC transporter substrate-binding protein [Pseudomonadota bacterium]
MKRRHFLLMPAAAGLAVALSPALRAYADAAVAQGTPVDGSLAQRIVVAGGDLTEIVFALGAGDRVIGVDQTSTWPPEVSERAQIGYVRRLSPEGVLSLAPDLLLAAHDAGPDIAFEQLEAAGVPVARAPRAKRAEDVAAKIRFVGQAIGKGAEAEALAAAYEADLASVSGKVATIDAAPRVLFVLSVRNGAPMVGGTDTSADAMIGHAGGVNAAAGVEGYKPMNREAIIAAAPEVILMMRQHAERLGGVGEIMAMPEIALTPAGLAGQAVTMDGMLLLGFGPRTPEAIAELARALHAERAVAAGL